MDFAYEVSRSLARVRRRAADRRCGAGRRGADGGQRPPGDEAGPHDHPGDQQDRPAERRHPDGQAAARGHPRDSRARKRSWPAPRRASASRKFSRRSSRASRRRRRPDDKLLRALVFDSDFRHLPRRGHPRARRSTAASKPGDAVKLMATGPSLRGEGGRHLQAAQPKFVAQTKLERRRRRLRHRQHQDDRAR